jgi:hypothetical protein
MIKSQVLSKHVKQVAYFLKVTGPGESDTTFPAANGLGIRNSYLFGDIFSRPTPASALSPKLLIWELPGYWELPGNAAHISLLSANKEDNLDY